MLEKTSDIVKNFRDVGFSVNTIAGDYLFPEKVLYRGGNLNSVFDHEEILNIPTILNLRSGADRNQFDCTYLHVPAEDKLENYNTSNGKVRKWINKVIGHFLEPQTLLPMFIHCTSGKDRTGVVTAAILKAYGVKENLIIKEYLLSEGVEGPANIQQALSGFGEIDKYLKDGFARQVVMKLNAER